MLPMSENLYRKVFRFSAKEHGWISDGVTT